MGTIQPTPALAGALSATHQTISVLSQELFHPVVLVPFKDKDTAPSLASRAMHGWTSQARPSLLTLLVFKSTRLLFGFSRLFSLPQSALPSFCLDNSLLSFPPSENTTEASLTPPGPGSHSPPGPLPSTEAFTPDQSYGWSVVISCMSLQEMAPLAGICLAHLPFPDQVGEDEAEHRVDVICWL